MNVRAPTQGQSSSQWWLLALPWLRASLCFSLDDHDAVGVRNRLHTDLEHSWPLETKRAEGVRMGRIQAPGEKRLGAIGLGLPGWALFLGPLSSVPLPSDSPEPSPASCLQDCPHSFRTAAPDAPGMESWEHFGFSLRPSLPTTRAGQAGRVQ